MWRRCGGSSMPPESNSSVPSYMIRPRSGVIRPAIMLTMDVLPEPDGPNSAVTPSGASNFAATVNSPSRFSTSTVSILDPVHPRADVAGEPFGGDQRNQRNDDGEHGEPRRRRVTRGDLQVSVDRRRDRLRLARNIRHERDRGAELAESLGKAQHHAGNDAGKRERQRDGEEHAQRIGAKRTARGFEARI